MVVVKACPISAGFASSNRSRLPPLTEDIETLPSVPTTWTGASMVIEAVKLLPSKKLLKTLAVSPGASPVEIAEKSI